MSKTQPLKCEAVLTLMGDGLWRSAYDLAALLYKHQVVEDYVTARLGRHKEPYLHQLDGYAKLVGPVLAELEAAKEIEARDEVRGDKTVRMYRSLVNRGPRMAEPEEMTRPGNTRFGVSLRQVYRLAYERPGITLDEMVEALGPCWKSADELEKLWSKVTRGRRHDEEASRIGKLPPDKRLHAMRRRFLWELIGPSKYLEARTTVRVFLCADNAENPKEVQNAADSGAAPDVAD